MSYPGLNNVLEFFWLIMAILTGLMGTYILFTNGFKSAYVFFIMSVLSLFLFLARRALRRKNSAGKL
jgi:hypothetical protein